MEKKIERVKCQSGIMGYQCRLQDSYDDVDEWFRYTNMFGLAKRLGYQNAYDCWIDNPIIQGSVIPTDFRIIHE